MPHISGENGETNVDGSESALRVSSYVLVVDDEDVVRDFLVRCVEGWGYDARQAASAAEALELMVEKAASIVLCDIKMPGQDGLWLAERVRAHWPGTAVVMVTALDDLQTINQSRQLGVVDYISKPIKQDQLQQVMRKAAAVAAASDYHAGADPVTAHAPDLQPHTERIEAEYTLEAPVRCPACGERITTLKAVRLIRAQVNFTSTLPRRGRVIACPHCLAVVPAELTNF
jgi:CheY-like chemotaxis protein/DNA-directed RNA polymerase subunit RPC12/RpoP